MSKQYRLAYTMRGPSQETEDMYLAEVPDLPGCRAWVETPELALPCLESVVEALVGSFLEDGDPCLPEVSTVGELVLFV